MCYEMERNAKKMLQTIEQINNVVNNFIWGVPAMICIIGVGLFLSVRTRFLQIRKFPYAMKVTIGRMLKKREASDGALTPFQAVCTALAATVGTGNVAGVAGAIAIGGPGAVFWMWISAILGMCTKFFEVTLAVHFRETNANGELVGGPMYYIKNGLKKHWLWLAYLFSAFGVLTVFGTGNATQVNTITTAIDSALYNFNLLSEESAPTLNLVIGIVLAALIALILIGGIKRIGQVTEKLVPFMAIMYILLAVGVVVVHIGSIPTVFSSIIRGAFDPAAVTGGAVGSFFMSMKKGVSRGIFSNEAGQGSGTFAAGAAEVEHPAQQGLVQVLAVFVDTLIICTLTAVTILITGCYNVIDPNGTAIISNLEGIDAGVIYLQRGVATTFGNFASIIIGICVILFTFTSILACYYQAESNMALFLKKENKAALMFVKLLGVAAILYGGLSVSQLVWNLADISCGLTVWLNLIVMILLAKPLFVTLKDYDRQRNNNVGRLTFDPKALGIKGADAELWEEINRR